MTTEIELDCNLLKDPKYDECWRLIFSYLPIKYRFQMKMVCKRWKRIAELPWKDITRLNCANAWTWPNTMTFDLTLPILEETLRMCGGVLKHLDFSGFHPTGNLHITDFDADEKFFKILETYCPNLKILDLYTITPTPDGIDYMADNCNRLIDFRVYDRNGNCDEALSNFFIKAPNLQAVTFYGCKQDVRCLSHLPVKTLKKIQLDYLYDESYEYLITLLKTSILESFEIRHCCLKQNKFSDIIVALAANAKALKELTLRVETGEKLANQVYNLHHFTNLQRLTLNVGKMLTDSLITLIGSYCRQLKSVKLMASREVTDKSIATLPDLEEIELRALPKVQGNFLSRMSKLKRVSFSYCGITDRSLHTLLDRAENLEHLYLKTHDYLNLKELVLHGSNVVRMRKTRIPFELVLNVDNITVKNVRNGLFSLRNA